MILERGEEMIAKGLPVRPSGCMKLAMDAKQWQDGRKFSNFNAQYASLRQGEA